MHNFFHDDPSVVIGLNRKTLGGILMACHSWSSLIFCAMRSRGEGKLLELQFVKEHMNPGPRGQVNVCQTLQQTGLFVCSQESSTARILIESSPTLFLCHAQWLSIPLCVCPCSSQVEWTNGGGWRRVELWREGELLAVGRFQSVSLAVAPRQWNARSLLHSLFWEVSLLAAALLNSLDYYQMAESTLVVWWRGA